MTFSLRGRSLSLRAKIAVIVLLGAVVPLGLVGAWLADGVRRSGDAILQARLDSSLAIAARDVGGTWVRRRSALLSITEYDDLRRALATTGAEGGSAGAATRLPLPIGRAEFTDLRDATDLVLVHGARQPIWILDADSGGAPTLVPAADSLRVAPARSATLTVRMPIYAGDGVSEVGHVEARMRIGALTSALSSGAALAGAVFAVVEPATGAASVPLPFDVARMREPRFQWAGEQWLTAARRLEEPVVELLAAAPVTAYVAPLDAAGRRGIIALVLVALAGIAVTLILTRRVTRSLVRLAAAADAVTHGDLSPRVECDSGDEVGRVARAFREMIDSLRRMLQERSEREAVAAVGEFASSLAHEIRNPLSTVRLNLQHLQERLPEDAANQAVVRRALADIDRLNRTLGGVLRMARSGSLPRASGDLRAVLHASAADADAELARRGVSLQCSLPDDPLVILGNMAALEQLFLNLLLNAIQATPRGGRVGVDVVAKEDAVAVIVWDEGGGFDRAGMEQAFEPFYSTRPEGTGLGLTIARRIAVAHGGAISIASDPGRGARVTVTLPAEARILTDMARSAPAHAT